jgi:hypothetical protein
MKKSLLRDRLLHNGAWSFTAAAFAVGGIGSLCGLMVANVRDPKALWLGSNVSHPQAICLFLDAQTLLAGVALGWLAVRGDRKPLDRSLQLAVDEEGIHDWRPGGEEIPWSEVSAVEVSAQHLPQGMLTGAKLEVVRKAGGTVTIDLFNLDRDHKAILKAVKQIRKAARD